MIQKANSLITRFDRQGFLKMHMIFNIKADPSNPACLYFTTAKNDQAVIVKWDMLKNTILSADVNNTIKQLPHFFYINDSWSQVFIGVVVQFNKKNSVNIHSYDTSTFSHIDFRTASDAKGNISFFSKTFLDGNNILSVFNDEQNNFKACWSCQIDFCRISSDLEITNYFDAKDCGLVDNQSIVCITKFNEHGCKVELFPSDPKACQVSFEIQENTIVEFIYPAIIIVKGWLELIVYNITENLYYYMELNAPILMQSATINDNNSLEMSLFYDMGEYLIFSILSFAVGAQSVFNHKYYKRYLEKAVFPKEKLLWGFDPVSTKFLTKTEQAIALQFSGTITSIGLLTHEWVQQTDCDFEHGELIHVYDDCFYTWKKSSKIIVSKPLPINFADR